MTLPRLIYTRTSQASVLLPILAGLANYKRLTLPFRIFLYFFIIAAGFEVQATLLDGVYANNMPGLHLYTFIEFIAFSLVYSLYFKKYSLIRILIIINMVIYVAAALTDAFYINGIWKPNTLSRSYSSISVILYTLIYFYSLFRIRQTQYSWRQPMFWVSTGALIYFGINAFYFMLVGYLLHNAAYVETASLLVHNALNIIAHCLYAQSFRCFRKQKAEL